MKPDLLKFGIPLAALVGVALLIGKGITAQGPLDIAQAPLFTRNALPPLNMLVMGRDHKLYYEAYNDASDLDGDKVLDVGYKPDKITYYGYYNSKVCYSSRSGTGGQLFDPVSAAGGSDGKQCTGLWSGDFLNYLTTSRMDALRKVLFGGYREVDTSSETILRASFTPQDAHSWGKEYSGVAHDGYDISKYAPLGAPGTGRYHLFAVTTLENNGIPQLRVLTNTNFRIWNWVSIERPVAGSDCFTSGNSRVNCVTGSSGSGSWEIVPSGSLSNLTIATWHDPNSQGSPGSTTAMDSLFSSTGSTSSNSCGSGSVSVINTTGSGNNPFRSSGGCTNDHYHTLISGDIYASEAGTYSFAVNGDDAVDVLIDNTLVANWYGGHGASDSNDSLNTHSGSIYLSQGSHTVVFRHQEGTGDDNWQLYWKTPASGGATGMTNYPLRVKVCSDNAALREDNCKVYQNNTSYKPTGILHDYGETNRMYFGLLTGSYSKNTTGGVLHKNMESFANEINSTTGQFCLNGNCGTNNDVKGIVYTISTFRILDFDYGSKAYGCGWITTRAVNEGECWMWGNPVAEMMYETLRYFAGAGTPRSEYNIGSSSQDVQTLGLPMPSWKSPYASTDKNGGGYPMCSQPTLTVLSDINPSYDYKVPGSHWSSLSGTGDPASLSDLNVSTEADAIWAAEGGGTKQIFIGESKGVVDNAPTPKAVSNLSSVRGLSPEEPSKQGTYYSASIARFGANHKIGGDKFVRTYSVALASPLPKFEFPVGSGTVTLVPFAKSVGGSSISATSDFQPTNQIVDFYVQKVANTGDGDRDGTVNGGRAYAEFRINYEDVEQGADHDMDAIVLYTLEVTETSQLKVTLKSEYAAGGIDQHMGYVISGTSQDGVYLEVCDLADGKTNDGTRSSCANQISYRFNTPPGRAPGYCNFSSMPSDCKGLPPTADRLFSVGTGVGATLLKDPLWYAAKYGNDQGVTLDTNGDPTNYFLVTNPLYLRQQLTKAFDAIQNQNGASGSLAVAGSRVSSGSFVVAPSYSSSDNGHDWIGDLEAYKVNSDATVGALIWKASAKMPDTPAEVTDRKIYTALTAVNSTNRSNMVREFKATELALDPANTSNAELFGRIGYTTGGVTSDFGGNVTPNQMVDYLRGERTMEGTVLNTMPFRRRSGIIGDIVNSAPVIATKRANYGWAAATGLPTADRNGYTTYVNGKASKGEYVYVGANDGMLHAFNDQGVEQFAYVPNGVLHKMGLLANRDYTHQYYVDGKLTLADAKVGGAWRTVLVGGSGAGGRGVSALDVTTPGDFDATSVLWEVNGATDDDIGYVMGKPLIVPIQNGKWVALFGNGYNSGTGKAALFAVDIATGTVLRKIVADDGSANAELGYNGLGNITAVDTDGNGLVDTVYGGDLHGNVWKFNVSDDAETSWDVAYKDGLNQNTPLFIARDSLGNRQPITGSFEIAVGPDTGYMLYFGTGRYFVTGDNSTKERNSVYGIWDNGTPITNGRTGLVEQKLTSVADDTSTTSDESQVRNVTRNPVSYYTHRGWYMDLTVDGKAQGERFIGTPTLREGLVYFTTYTPGVGDDCKPGGTNWLYALNAETGAAGFGEVEIPAGSTPIGGGSTGGASVSDGAPVQGVSTITPTPTQTKYCDPADSTCTPSSVPSSTQCTENIVSQVSPAETISRVRACGRQSWRQLR